MKPCKPRERQESPGQVCANVEETTINQEIESMEQEQLPKHAQDTELQFCTTQEDGLKMSCVLTNVAFSLGVRWSDLLTFGIIAFPWLI